MIAEYVHWRSVPESAKEKMEKVLQRIGEEYEGNRRQHERIGDSEKPATRIARGNKRAFPDEEQQMTSAYSLDKLLR